MQQPGAPSTEVTLRVVSTYGDDVRRADVRVGAGESAVVEDGVVTPFPTEQLWPRVRDLLPAVAPLRADPRGRPAPARREPEPGFAESCEAFAVLTTVLTTAAGDEVVALRSWLATDDELWSADPRPDGSTDLRPAAEGALADLVVWDVTGALQLLLAASRSGGATP